MRIILSIKNYFGKNVAIVKKFKVAAIIVVIFIIGLFHNPIHDLNLFKMRLSFIDIDSVQPTGTHFIWRKSYIGGQGSNGSWKCNYMVGELRSFGGSREKVIEQYQKILNYNDDIGILFMNGDSWPLDSILWDWRGEFLDQNHIENGKYYIIYISKKFPAFLDLRCKGY
jgi:hypothetical protein